MERLTELEYLRQYVTKMAQQQLIAEMEDPEYADFEGAWDFVVNDARECLARIGTICHNN